MSTGKTQLRPATAADVVAVCGDKAPRTLRAWVLDVDGAPAALAGYYMAGNAAVMFSDIARPVPKTAIYRAARAVMERMTFPALCVATPGAERFLERLGWVRAGMAENGAVYQWN